MTYRIRNWAKFQHFKDRNPPWVKLYKDVLDDPDWHELDPLAAKVLVMLWLIASEDDSKQGTLPENKKLAFRLRISEKNLCITLSQLKNWLIQDDIKVISSGYPTDAPETETETETDSSFAVSPSKPKFSAVDYLKSLGVSDSVISDWITLRKSKKAPVTGTAIAGIIREAEKAGWSLSDALAKSCERGWTGFKADWVSGENKPDLAKHNPSEMVTLPDGRVMNRGTLDFLKRMSA